MDWKGMFSFTREETDLQTGRKKNSRELDEKGRSVLSAKPKEWISVAEEHFFLDLIQQKQK